jgi:fungal STAND N-terminal Goodbye domain
MTDNEDLEALWKDAFAAYEKETDRKLSHDAVLRRLRSTDDLLEQIESEGRAFQDWRNKHRRLWSSLSAFLAPVAAIGGIALGAASNFPPAAAVLGSVLYLVRVSVPPLQWRSADIVQSCEQVVSAYDWVEQIFAELQEFSDRLTQYTKSEMDPALRKKVTAILTLYDLPCHFSGGCATDIYLAFFESLAGQ